MYLFSLNDHLSLAHKSTPTTIWTEQGMRIKNKFL